MKKLNRFESIKFKEQFFNNLEHRENGDLYYHCGGINFYVRTSKMNGKLYYSFSIGSRLFKLSEDDPNVREYFAYDL